MELQNFDKILERVPKMSRPMRVILAGSDGENMLKGIFAAQEKGLVQPVLVGDRARTITVLEQFGLEREPYTMVDTPPGHNITRRPSTSSMRATAMCSCAATSPRVTSSCPCWTRPTSSAPSGS